MSSANRRATRRRAAWDANSGGRLRGLDTPRGAFGSRCTNRRLQLDRTPRGIAHRNCLKTGLHGVTHVTSRYASWNMHSGQCFSIGASRHALRICRLSRHVLTRLGRSHIIMLSIYMRWMQQSVHVSRRTVAVYPSRAPTQYVHSTCRTPTTRTTRQP